MARMSEATVREAALPSAHALEYVVALHSPEPGRGWFVDLAFDPLEQTRAAATTTTAAAAAAAATTTPSPVTAVTNNAPVSVIVSVAQGASRTFPCPYCASPYAYANQAGLRRHITKCH